MRMTDLRWRILASYLTAASIGSGLSQYQWMVSSVTSLTQVLSSGLVLAKILSRKLNSSSSTCVRRRIAKQKTVKRLCKGFTHLDGCISDGGNMPQVVLMGMCSVSPRWHIHPSPSRKKKQLFQSLVESGVSNITFNNGLLGTKLYIPLDLSISFGL